MEMYKDLAKGCPLQACLYNTEKVKQALTSNAR